MKKRLAILSLVAIFVSFSALNAQTKPVVKAAKATTEVKCEKKADAKACTAKDEKATTCCKGKTAAECKAMTPAEKAKCEADCKKEGKTCTSKDAKVTSKTDVKACDKKADAPKACCAKKV